MLDSSHRHLRYLPVKLLTFTFYISKIYLRKYSGIGIYHRSKTSRPLTVRLILKVLYKTRKLLVRSCGEPLIYIYSSLNTKHHQETGKRTSQMVMIGRIVVRTFSIITDFII